MYFWNIEIIGTEAFHNIFVEEYLKNQYHVEKYSVNRIIKSMNSNSP